MLVDFLEKYQLKDKQLKEKCLILKLKKEKIRGEKKTVLILDNLNLWLLFIIIYIYKVIFNIIIIIYFNIKKHYPKKVDVKCNSNFEIIFRIMVWYNDKKFYQLILIIFIIKYVNYDNSILK